MIRLMEQFTNLSFQTIATPYVIAHYAIGILLNSNYISDETTVFR